MADVTYWAHSDPNGLSWDADGANWQPLSEHLRNVGAMAARLAAEAAPGDSEFQALARECGLLHDFGKYSDGFQRMITGGGGRCPHSIHGAVLAAFGLREDEPPPAHIHAALAIAGHHGGIPDGTGGESSLTERLRRSREEACGLFQRAAADSEELRELFESGLRSLGRVPPGQFDLYTRMLFGCLVDADRLDTAGRPIVQAPLDAGGRLARLRNHVAELSSRSSGTAVQAAREEILRDCLAAAELRGPLFSLSAPTGGGKTLAAMAFALRRAEIFAHAYRRVIVVIPYLSIIEQNARVYAGVFGGDAILEHHSGSFVRLTSREDREYIPEGSATDEFERPARRNEVENWDYPCIVTTSVRFFETLFSNRPSDLRRAHNVARSIIILDEVQTLPRRLLTPLLSVIRELTEHWGCSFVFSTATQPAFEAVSESAGPRWGRGTIQEILGRPAVLRNTLRRVNIGWELSESVSWHGLALRMLAQRQALAIVNLRDHASALYERLRSLAEEAGVDPGAVFHLSTRMCPLHRLEVIDRIKRRVSSGEPCWVASTQLVEAGVDLDFPAVFRAIGPLDSIIQAAGRADREGLRTQVEGKPAGAVTVFLPEEDRMPPGVYREATQITLNMVRERQMSGRDIQVTDSEVVSEYFERLYSGGANLGMELQDLRAKMRFAGLAEAFEMIEGRTRDVFVPFDERAQQWISRLRGVGRITSEIGRALQPYVVGLHPWEFQKALGVLEQVRPPSEVWVASEAAYSKEMGLRFEFQAEDLVLV